jgi:hypothetical protein
MKQPWQMTRKEWEQEREAIRPETFGSSTKHGGALALRRHQRLTFLLYGCVDPDGPIFHKDVVKKALDEGKPVPKKVLKDYPFFQSNV